MSGRITLHLDPGLGWTKLQVVACCGVCGTELARHPNQDRAIRTARRRRCPGCGTRTARRLPGTTSPDSDLALSRGLPGGPSRQREPPNRHRSPTPPATPPAPHSPRSSPSWKESCHGSRQHLANRHGRRHLGRVLHGLPAGPVPR